MASCISRRLLVLRALALLAGLWGTAAKADALYTITNLGSDGITLTTASGGTIAASANGLPFANTVATSQLTSVSNGQVSYSFATTPDTALIQGQGALSSVPASLNIDPNVYSSPEVTGFANANGFAALAVTLPVTSDFPQPGYETASAYPVSPSGEVNWGQGATITSSPALGFTGGYIEIAGLNSTNQALVGTGFNNQPYDALVYSLSSKSVTDLDTLSAITSGGYSNLEPIAIDNRGQILVLAPYEATANGYGVDILLLTPNGEPIVMTPEPSTCVTWALIAGPSWFAANRRRTRS